MKTRTREHVIADLAVNYLERRVLWQGFTLDRVQHDYGVDLAMSTYNENGEVESGQVLFQVKASDRVRFLKVAKAVSFALDRDGSNGGEDPTL
jgi:hypothetical protein